MKTKDFESHSIYPGEFMPGANEAFLIKQVNTMTTDSEANRPYTNVKELIDEYKIEIAAPGFEREQLIVYADKNDLLVCATENYAVQPGKCFRRHVSLPDDADVELAIAEYRNNILELYIPKAKQSCKTGTTRIIVY